jgi:hypothetical protein
MYERIFPDRLSVLREKLNDTQLGSLTVRQKEKDQPTGSIT